MATVVEPIHLTLTAAVASRSLPYRTQDRNDFNGRAILTGLARGLLNEQDVTRSKLTFAALTVLPALAIATGCNNHPLEEVEYVDGGIDFDEGEDESGDAGDDEDGEDAGEDGDDFGEDAGEDDGTLDGADDGFGDDDDDDDDAPGCTEEIIDIAANPPEVMLVLDKSGSMSDATWEHDGQQVMRWTSLHSVVTNLVDSYDATMNFGAVLFPARDSQGTGGSFEGMCGVAEQPDVATGPLQGEQILEALPGAYEEVQGATPAREGVTVALETLVGLQTEGHKAMVLVTDGLANCADENEPFEYDEAFPSVVAAAASVGIPTYVVGIDIRDEFVGYANANAAEELDVVARAGGQPASEEVAYYDARDEDALYDALDEIAEQLECTIPLASDAPEDAEVTIAVDGEEIAQVEACTDGDGWRFTDATRGTIELCNAACDALRVHGEVQSTVCEPDDGGLPTPSGLPIP